KGAARLSASRNFCASANALSSGEIVRVVPATKRMSSLAAGPALSDSTRVFPHHPRPTIAALIMAGASELHARERHGSGPNERKLRVGGQRGGRRHTKLLAH